MPCKWLSLVAGAHRPPNAGDISQRVRPSILLLGIHLQRSDDCAETFVVALEHRHRLFAAVKMICRRACVVVQANVVAGGLSGSCRRTPSGLARVKSLTRRPTAGWRPRWQRSGTADARSGTARHAAMNESVASDIFHLRPWEQGSGDGRTGKMVPLGQVVEIPAKIAMRAPPRRRFAVELLQRSSPRRRKFSPPFRAYRPVMPLSTARVCAFT